MSEGLARGKLRPMAFLTEMRAGLFSCGVLLSGCATTAAPEVHDVARHDLACPRVEVAEVTGERYAASGCGKGAVYARLCDDQGCRWGRLRHGHEANLSGVAPAAGAEQPPAREILPAPVPNKREVIAAPAPGTPEREVQPAPPPESP